MWIVLENKGVLIRYDDAIKDMYNWVVTVVYTVWGETCEFLIKIGLHQGSILIPCLFALAINESIRNIQEDIIIFIIL